MGSKNPQHHKDWDPSGLQCRQWARRHTHEVRARPLPLAESRVDVSRLGRMRGADPISPLLLLAVACARAHVRFLCCARRRRAASDLSLALAAGGDRRGAWWEGTMLWAIAAYSPGSGRSAKTPHGGSTAVFRCFAV